MARNALTSFLHPERKEHIVSLYRGSRGTYVSVNYTSPYKLFDLGFEDEEDTIGPKVIVEWSE